MITTSEQGSAPSAEQGSGLKEQISILGIPDKMSPLDLAAHTQLNEAEKIRKQLEEKERERDLQQSKIAKKAEGVMLRQMVGYDGGKRPGFWNYESGSEILGNEIKDGKYLREAIAAKISALREVEKFIEENPALAERTNEILKEEADIIQRIAFGVALREFLGSEVSLTEATIQQYEEKYKTGEFQIEPGHYTIAQVIFDRYRSTIEDLFKDSVYSTSSVNEGINRTKKLIDPIQTVGIGGSFGARGKPGI